MGRIIAGRILCLYHVRLICHMDSSIQFRFFLAVSVFLSIVEGIDVLPGSFCVIRDRGDICLLPGIRASCLYSLSVFRRSGSSGRCHLPIT